jgi:hypothetical protein
VKHFSFSFSDLGVDKNSIEKIMGFEQGNSPLPFPELISNVLEKAKDLPNIRGEYELFEPVRFSRGKDRITICEKVLNIKEKIGTELAGITSAAIFLSTAGPEIQEWSEDLLNQGDPTTSYIVDVLGSEIAEAVAEIIHDRVEAEMNEKGLSVTTRFSPGYCEWNVEDQHVIFSLLKENFCNIQLTESALMVPVKSVSGIIGIGQQVRKRRSACNACDRLDCVYRNLGETG